MNDQLTTAWGPALDACAARVHPLLGELCRDYPMQYHWTSCQTEWAQDVVFQDPAQLRRLNPQLLHLGIIGLSCADVMRFMGKKVNHKGDTDSPWGHEVLTDRKTREEGARVKHRLGRNSIKFYDKAYTRAGAVLRFEVTINEAKPFKVFRQKSGDDNGPLSWRPLRAGIADLHRRAEVSQAALDRYATAMARADDSTTLHQLTMAVEKRVCWKGRRMRPPQPFQSDDLELLRIVSHGEFAIHGLRNRDLRKVLYSTAADHTQARKRSAAISRKLRLLRAHGILHKVPHTHRYLLSPRGRLLCNAVLSAQRTTSQQLAALAA